MNKLCRICSGTGLYDIFSRIPFYVHFSPNEFNEWKKTIAMLIEDITGCVVSKGDRLPQKICSVCISYLQHATIFRQQAIDNIQNLKTARDEHLTQPMNEENPNPNSPVTGNNDKFVKSNSNMNLEAFDEINHFIGLFFGDNNEDDKDDEVDDADDDQTAKNGTLSNVKIETVKSAIHNFFNCTERIFEEEDLSKVDGIGISKPDDHKERKCYVCKRNFMLKDSFDDHMKECIQAKLFSFNINCIQLAVIKKHKAISAQEFIRRMIFAVKSIVKSLAMCYHVTSRPAANVSAQSAGLRTTSATLNNMTDGTPTVMENKVHNLFIDMENCPPARLLPNPATLFAPKTNKNFPKLCNFAAKCPSCNQVFDSIQAFETHNQQLHNPLREIYGRSDETPSVSSSDNASNTLRDLLNSDDYVSDGIIDLMRLHQWNPHSLNIHVSTDYNSLNGF